MLHKADMPQSEIRRKVIIIDTNIVIAIFQKAIAYILFNSPFSRLRTWPGVSSEIGT